MEILGIKACIYLEFTGSLEELGTKLSNNLYLSEFYYDTDQDYPHQKFGSSESLGTEIWLRSSNKVEGYNYILELESEHCLDESLNGQMHNMSPWLARYISDICKIKCFINEDRQ